MGNSQGKESRPGSSRGLAHARSSSNSGPSASGSGGAPQDSHHNVVYHTRSGRGSRSDLSSFLGLSGSSERDPMLEQRRETKAEREARKREKEQILRAQERERSIREENVDGGFLVTLGTYTGPEDFNKSVVRQLQIERRLAPFWKGLNDHSDTWTEHQLIAVVNGLPLPAADEIPPEEPPQPNNNLSADWNPRSSNSNINNLTVPITSRSLSQGSDRSANLSPSHPAFSLSSPGSPVSAPTSSSSPLFRGRAKTLAASLAIGSRNNSQTEMTPQEIQLPKDRYINGQRIEVFLYKDAAECPICFLYYPPYLNKTRCCDQPICSECFVQIKRPDPHPPEHHDPNDPSSTQTEPQDEIQLVSEPAACPFCVQPDFGVTYDPPPFRRGLAYANQIHNPSAMSSSSSLNSEGLPKSGRRRATSLAANDSSVITTDRVRPDWAKKLADARAHALRRAAAATALHNAAYMMGNLESSGSRGFGLGRRRRNVLGGDSAASSGQGTPQRESNQASLPTTGSSHRNDGQSDLFPGRGSSRRNPRLEDLEELMMMEAIRLSLAEEERRKAEEEKKAAKEAKKEEKRKAKEAKKAEKASRKTGSGSGPGRSLDGEGEPSAVVGKGKEVDRSGGGAGFNPLTEPTSTVNATSSKDDPQRHLENSRAQIQRETSGTVKVLTPDESVETPNHRASLRNLSHASSMSSLSESLSDSIRQSQEEPAASGSSLDISANASGAGLDRDETPQDETPGTEPLFNFSSLEAVISADKQDEENKAEYIEDTLKTEGAANEGPSSSKENVALHPSTSGAEDELEESVVTLKPTQAAEEEDEVAPVPRVGVVTGDDPAGLDAKHIGDVCMTDARGQTTQ